MKRQRSTELPRFVVGALATAGVSVAGGATVQITFGNNVVSLSSGVSNFVPDLTGDGTVDVFGFATTATGFVGVSWAGGWLGEATSNTGSIVLGGVPGGWVPGTTRGLVPFTFSDAGIHNGDATSGFVDVEGWATVGTSASVKIHRLIFDDASTAAPSGVAYTDADFPEYVAAVPEPSSNLALLALGVGGLTLRRRLKRVA